MNKIEWKSFPLTDLFIVSGTTTTPKNKLELKEDGLYPYITTAATNNGVNEYSDIYTEEGNVLTVDSAVLGTTFYQKENFTASDHVEKLTPKFLMTENIALFIASVMNGTARLYGYAYNEKRSQTALKKELIPLPATTGGEPNFNFMEKYIDNKLKEEALAYETYKNILFSDNETNVDTCKWKKFNLYDENLFKIDTGTKLDRSKMTINNPTINFVGRANANNGITACVDEISGLSPYPAGYLTVSLGGEYLGSCFIQPKSFYTSQNVIVLIPRTQMSFNVKQFIATMIFKESRTHYKAFVDELNRHIKTDFSFYLPITNLGTPDFEYMEKYIQNINKKTNSFYKILEKNG